MKCLIVEDDIMSSTLLEQLCSKVVGLEVLKVCDNATSALEVLQTQKIDLMFLDIELPGITGIDLIKELDNLPQIIITSGKKQYAAEAFEHIEYVVDYIVKPVSLPRLINAVSKAKNASTSPRSSTINADYLFVKSEGRIVKVCFNDLEYIETVGDYVKFKTTTGQHLIHSTLKNIDNKINHSDIIKVHRSYLINISKIVDIQDNSILIGKKIIPVSRAHKASLLSRINPL